MKIRTIHAAILILPLVAATPVFLAPNLAQAETRSITARALTIRSGPGTNYRSLGTVARGTQVEVLRSSGNWLRVRVPNRGIAWLHKNFTQVVSSGSSSTQAYRVTANSLNMRSGAGTRYRILASLRRNEAVQYHGRSGNWAKVTARGKTGWVSSRYVQPQSGSAGAANRLRGESGSGSTTAASADRGGSSSTTASATRSANGGRVIYGRFTVSDALVRRSLQTIANITGKDVILTSGDRNHVPRGGSRNSLHLRKRAADFYIRGLTLEAGFDLIRSRRSEILSGGGFEVIYHKPGTSTGGPHLHLGHRSSSAHKIMTEVGGRYTRWR